MLHLILTMNPKTPIFFWGSQPLLMNFQANCLDNESDLVGYRGTEEGEKLNNISELNNKCDGYHVSVNVADNFADFKMKINDILYHYPDTLPNYFKPSDFSWCYMKLYDHTDDFYAKIHFVVYLNKENSSVQNFLKIIPVIIQSTLSTDGFNSNINFNLNLSGYNLSDHKVGNQASVSEILNDGNPYWFNSADLSIRSKYPK